MTVAAVVALDDFDRDGAWPLTRRCLLDWQIAGRAHVVVNGVPIDVMTLALARSADDLTLIAAEHVPEAVAGRAEIIVFDPKLAHGLIRTAAERARRDRPDGPAAPA